MRKPIAYLASPLGFSEAGRFFYEKVLLPLVRMTGFKIRDPWTLTPPKLIDQALNLPYGQEKRATWQKINPVIGRNNADAIRESDIIIAVLDGTDVDSGTAAEIGFGAALGKTIFGYRGDFRLSADNDGSIVNLQVEYFIRSNGGEIVTGLQSLNECLANYARDFQEKSS